ncbi:MAG: PEP-CTERM sorting domain-containing protein [Gammaproteobacteria bacterium]|nr:PEP-CTERM sorting domain-containing protein [Gammaproteobacteria bacterium]
MKFHGIVICVLVALSPVQALGYIIDYTGTMEMSRTPWGAPDPSSQEKFDVYFEVEADSETLRFLTMSIWVDGLKLTRRIPNSDYVARWKYDLNQWNAVDGFYWFFEHEEYRYALDWSWVEIPSPIISNPIEEFHRVAEGPWYFSVYNVNYETQYSAWHKGDIAGFPRPVSEPATIFLIAFGLIGLAIRQLGFVSSWT